MVLLALVVLTPFRLYAVVLDLTGLPSTLYGYVTDSRTGAPVAGARVRVISPTGVDVTAGEWQTDSRGFFLIKVAVPVGRSSYIRVLPQDCVEEAMLPLSSDYERGTAPAAAPVKRLSPLFFFTVSCKERK